MELLYYTGIKPFIKSLEKPTRSKVLRSIQLLEKYGQDLAMPHVKKLTDFIYELRVRGKQEIRLLFVIQNGKAYLLHGFIKKTQKTPKNEIKTAENRLKLLT